MQAQAMPDMVHEYVSISLAAWTWDNLNLKRQH